MGGGTVEVIKIAERKTYIFGDGNFVSGSMTSIDANALPSKIGDKRIIAFAGKYNSADENGVLGISIKARGSNLEYIGDLLIDQDNETVRNAGSFSVQAVLENKNSGSNNYIDIYAICI